MFKLDMHSHTKGSDGMSSPVDIAHAAKAAGLDGLCLTDHHTNTVGDNAEVHRVAEALEAVGVRAFVGVEYSTEMNHLLIFGIDVPVPALAWGMYPNIQAVIDEVNAMGGACVVPHPYKGYARAAKDHVTGLQGLAAIEGYNGQVETRSPETNALARGAAQRMGLPITGGSDAHWAGMIGIAWTEFDRVIEDDHDLCAALHAGNFRACVDHARVASERNKFTARRGSFPRKRHAKQAALLPSYEQYPGWLDDLDATQPFGE